MKPLLTTFLFLGMCLTADSAEGKKTPEQQYREYMKSYGTVGGEFRKAETDQQRKQAVERLDEFPQKFLDLAEKNPKNPIALQALRQAVQAVISVDSLAHHSAEMNDKAFPKGSQGDAAKQIVRLLLRDHLKSAGLALICDRMRWGLRKDFERFLTAALETNANRNVQGMACLALAQLMHNHLRMVDLANERPELIVRYDYLYGKGYFQKIQGEGRSKLVEKLERQYERAAEFDDVNNIPFSSSVADKAESELYDLRNLSVGKSAPDIKGRDHNGEQFSLSDYLGNVVLLYFWNEY